MNKHLLSTTGLVLAIILFVSFNIVLNGNLKSARIDLTENNLYTLSDGSLNILESLEQPITLRFYYSEQVAQALPSLKAYAQRVQELLEEYQRSSNGMIRLITVNPEPFSDNEQRAKNYGLQAVPIDGEPDPLYFGLAGTNLLDGVESISFFHPEKEDVLEYELTKLLFKLSSADRKSIAVMSALPVDGEQYDPLKGETPSPDGPKPWAFMNELRQMFNVSVLPNDIRRIPSSVDVLLVIHPKDFQDRALYAIDQYVLNGGKLIAFVDPYAEIDIPERNPDNPMAAMVANRSSNMENLFKQWGFERSKPDVIADRKSIAVMSALPVDGEQYDPLKGETPSPDGPKPWAFMNELRQMFNVSVLPSDIRRIPSSVDVLLVIHPKDFQDRALYAIDQYVLNGGKLIAFVDPYAEIDIPERDPDNPMAAMVANRSSNMENLFKQWGFERSKPDVIADRKTAMKVDFGARSNNQAIDYVLWQAIGDDQFNTSETITNHLKRLEMATTGLFNILDDKTTNVVPLVSSSNEAMLVNKRVVQFRNDPMALFTKYVAGTKSYPIIVRATGDVKTAFPEGFNGKDGKPMPFHRNDSKQPIDVIAIADVDMLQDRFWVQIQDFYGQQVNFNKSDNINFLTNAIDELTDNTGLISIRSRVGYSRPFDLVIELQRDAEQRFRTKERELQKKLKETQQRIARMQVERSGSGEEILNDQQQKEIAEFRQELNKTQQQLREVQGDLRKEIDDLDTQLKFFNIGLVPILIALIAVVSGWMRIRKRTKGRNQH